MSCVGGNDTLFNLYGLEPGFITKVVFPGCGPDGGTLAAVHRERAETKAGGRGSRVGRSGQIRAQSGDAVLCIPHKVDLSLLQSRPHDH